MKIGKMTFTRFQTILLAVLLVQLMLIGIVYAPRKQAAAGGPLLGDLTAEEITQITEPFSI